MGSGQEDDPTEYCRQIEKYLVRRNGGHLIRIRATSFELVLGWLAKGIPIKVVERGSDRYLERDHAKKAGRRRPVPIEFCEADVLDVFDEWRRAVGVAPAAPESPTRQPSLPAHLERVIARLTTLRGGGDRTLDEAIEAAVRELDAARAGAKGLRGEARAQFVERLRALDVSLLAVVRSRCDAAQLEQLGAEADAELGPFRERMPHEAYAQARRACIDRLLRDRSRLPTVGFE